MRNGTGGEELSHKDVNNLSAVPKRLRREGIAISRDHDLITYIPVEKVQMLLTFLKSSFMCPSW
jgi:hypothetical protein